MPFIPFLSSLERSRHIAQMPSVFRLIASSPHAHLVNFRCLAFGRSARGIGRMSCCIKHRVVSLSLSLSPLNASDRRSSGLGPSTSSSLILMAMHGGIKRRFLCLSSTAESQHLLSFSRMADCHGARTAHHSPYRSFVCLLGKEETER